MKNELFVVGIGPGAASQLTAEASAVIGAADCIVAAPRHTALAAGHAKVLILRDFAETFEKMTAELEKGSVAVLVSGDPGMYSLLPLIRKKFGGARIKIIPGIGALQSLCAETGESWNDAVILSGHGRRLSEARLLVTADRNSKTILFCGGDKTPGWVCKTLAENGVDGVEVIVGERLSYSDQRISKGKAALLTRRSFDPLSLVMILNGEPWQPPFNRLRDEDFIRSGVPMTKSEVRSAILDRLELTPDAVFWDIGAGTGSIAVSAALLCPEGEVYAVDNNPQAIELEKENRKKYHCFNMKIHQGRCPEALTVLPRPTHVFIGGSGGELREILRAVAALGGGIRVVVSAVSLQAICAAAEVMEGAGFSSPEAAQFAVSKSKAAGNCTIMASQNPVTIFSAWTNNMEGRGKR